MVLRSGLRGVPYRGSGFLGLLIRLQQRGHVPTIGSAGRGFGPAEAVEDVLGRVLLASAEVVAPVILVTAMCGIAVRLYLLSAVGLDHPHAGPKFRWLFPPLFILDALWAASPLLLARRIGFGLALGAVAALAYLPFAQRTLMLSAGRNPKHAV